MASCGICTACENLASAAGRLRHRGVRCDELFEAVDVFGVVQRQLAAISLRKHAKRVA